MRLTELEPTFLTITEAKTYRMHDDIATADGVHFLCPKCFAKNGGNVGTHWVTCWSPKVSQDYDPKPGRWELHGTGYDNLTLVAGSSSILLQGGCNAHFWIRDGAIVQ